MEDFETYCDWCENKVICRYADLFKKHMKLAVDMQFYNLLFENTQPLTWVKCTRYVKKSK